MSEKEKTRILQRARVSIHDWPAYSGKEHEDEFNELYVQIRRALASEPDAVVVLRWLSEVGLPMARGCIKTLPDDKEHYQGELMALENVQGYIEDELGVRLTDDGGWEWVEEGGNETDSLAGRCVE